MTKVSFFVLSEGADSLQYACRVTEKAHRLGSTVFLYSPDTDRIQRLDDMLWTFRQGSFVPHSQDSNDAETPVLLGCVTPPEHHHQLMVNLAADVPPFFSRFERVIEIVNHDEKAAGRARYKFYQDRGYELETHKIEPT